MHGGKNKFRALWLARLARGHWPDRNPLRRRCDRLETIMLTTLTIVFLAAAPFAAQASAGAAWAQGHQEQLIQEATYRQVPALVLKQTSYWPDGGYTAQQSDVVIRWTTPDGKSRTAEDLLPSARPTGSTVRIWIDGRGQLTDAPLLGSQVANRAILAGTAGVIGLAVAVAAACGLIRRLLDRQRMRAWEAEWRAAGPRWTTRT